MTDERGGEGEEYDRGTRFARLRELLSEEITNHRLSIRFRLGYRIARDKG